MYLFPKKRLNYSNKLRVSLKNLYFINFKFKLLYFRLQNTCGKNNFDKFTIFSKKSKKYKLISRLCYENFLNFNIISVLASVSIDPNRFKCIGLFFNAIGCWFHSSYSSNLTSFTFLGFFNLKIEKKLIFNDLMRFWPRSLLQMNCFTFISFLELTRDNQKRIKILKSSGTRGLMLVNTYKTEFAIVILPSLKIKICKNSVFAFVGPLFFPNKRFFFYGKAGYNVNKGWKSTVRGTVKNACDHPNGGRTRALKCSKTPWGTIAKKPKRMGYLRFLKTKNKRLIKIRRRYFSDETSENIDYNLDIAFLSKYMLKVIK